MGIFSFLCSCKNNNINAQDSRKYENIKLEDITSRFDPEEGWNDIFLKITSETITKTTHIYIAKGLYKDKAVGLQIEINSKISAGIVNGQIDNKNGFVTKGIQLKSIGEESDELIKALAELYKQPTTKGFTKEIISATAFSLNEKPADLDKQDSYKFKLFFAENDEKLYSELYLNINTQTGEIELNEKDEGYREPILKLLTN